MDVVLNSRFLLHKVTIDGSSVVAEAKRCKHESVWLRFVKKWYEYCTRYW